jgi:transcriptional regulator with XRE-family HTH domain
MSERRDRFAVNLKRARRRAGLSQEELGFRADLNRTTISLYERSLREPGIDAIVKMTAALGTTPDALCEGIAWLPKKHRFKVERPR